MHIALVQHGCSEDPETCLERVHAGIAEAAAGGAGTEDAAAGDRVATGAGEGTSGDSVAGRGVSG